eukprot:366032-Chlamydomonas_euryale.AAC.6
MGAGGIPKAGVAGSRPYLRLEALYVDCAYAGSVPSRKYIYVAAMEAVRTWLHRMCMLVISSNGRRAAPA